MASTTVSEFEVGWSSSNAALLGSDVSDFRVSGTGSLRLTARAGAAGVTAAFAPATQLDLRAYDEFRLWTYASRAADGSPRAPFLLELSYTDAADTPGEEHRWLVPVNRRRTWEQHRFGIAGDRRGRITAFSLRCLTDEPFQIFFDEFLAVADEPLQDVETALADLLDGLPLPGVDALPLTAAAAADASTIVVARNRKLHTRNRITVDASGAQHQVTGAVHDDVAGTTTLTIQPVLAAAMSNGATISVTAPIRFEESPFNEPADTGDLPDPVVLVTQTDQREEPQRASDIPQRDSFRVRDGLTVCSLRPAPRPVLAEYQILPAASDRTQSLALRTEILRRVGVDTGLRVNGTVLPVRTLLPPPLDIRVRATPAPIYLHVGTRIETGARVEVPWVRQGQVLSGQLGSPEDQEGIVLRL
ncbi:hypothetical protein [Flindersiella endophytica]